MYGLSHGGFATCRLLGRTDRFRAGVAENPVTDWFTEIGTMDAPWWIDTLLGRPDDDLRCPATEAEQYYRVLRRRGVPTEVLRLSTTSDPGSVRHPLLRRRTRRSWSGSPATCSATG